MIINSEYVKQKLTIKWIYYKRTYFFTMTDFIFVNTYINIKPINPNLLIKIKLVFEQENQCVKNGKCFL